MVKGSSPSEEMVLRLNENSQILWKKFLVLFVNKIKYNLSNQLKKIR